MRDAPKTRWIDPDESEVIDRLARRYVEIEQRHDPDPDGDWASLSEWQRGFYRQCIAELLLREREAIHAAIAEQDAEATQSGSSYVPERDPLSMKAEKIWQAGADYWK